MLGRPDELAFNCPRIAGLSATDAWDLSRAQTIGRQKIRRIARFFKTHVKGFENSYIGTIAPMVGVRESRRIVGDYTLTEEDYLTEARFPDAVARNSYPIDIHSVKAKGGLIMKHLPPGHYHEIPYRCLLPVGIENLLVAGPLPVRHVCRAGRRAYPAELPRPGRSGRPGCCAVPGTKRPAPADRHGRTAAAIEWRGGADMSEEPRSVRIRPYAPGDARAFHDLNVQWLTTFFVVEAKDEAMLTDPERLILNPGGQILVADQEGQSIGCVALIPTPDDAYEVAKMAVAPELQGQGIGRRLLEAAIAWARERGAGRLYLESNARLTPALRLYESLGFRHLPPEVRPVSPYSRADVFMEMSLEDKMP